MKKIIISFFVILISQILLKAQVLNVNQFIQEQNQWCWAGASACILDYYCTPTSQCVIAEYTRTVETFPDISFGNSNCCISPSSCNNWNYNWGGPGSIQDILIHFSNITNTGVSRALTQDEVAQSIQANRLFVIRWGWSSGGGHFVVGHGLEGNNLYYMDPWYGEGLKVSTYSWVVSDGSHTWTHTNVLLISPHSDPPSAAELITGNASVCQEQNSVNYSITEISDATSYQWTLPSGATGTSTTNSISVNYGASATSGNISVKGINNCGEGTASTISITVNSKPPQPETITGNTNVPLGTSATYSISPVIGADSYTWTFTGNGLLIENGTNVTLTPTSSGKISVVANNDCGSSLSSELEITVTELKELQLQLGVGYTWFSVNLNPGNMNPNNVLQHMSPCPNDRIIGQTLFSVFTNPIWVGSIQEISPAQMYKLKTCFAQNLRLEGAPVQNSQISLQSGYSWLGYIPQTCLSPDIALAGLTPQASVNDRLIGQDKFAVYNGTQWLGSLTTMCPGRGYIIKLANNSIFTYPELPQVSTNPISNITETKVTSGGSVSSDGGNAVTSKGVVFSTTINPTILSNDGFTMNGTGLNEFISELTELHPGTTYFLRAYATNSLGTAYGEQFTFTTVSVVCGTAYTDDRDDYVYETVQIGNQCWMKQNLNFSTQSGSWCYLNNPVNCTIYGRLYDWNTAMNGASSSNSNPSGVKGLCPAGWHFPSDSEWQELEMFLGMSSNDAFIVGSRGTDQGFKLKSATGWNQDGNGSNSSGFTGLPGGNYPSQGLGYRAYWWTSTSFATIPAWARSLNYNKTQVDRYLASRDYGHSVRCIKNQGNLGNLPSVITAEISSITSTTATSGGTITNNGGTAITARGIVWNTSPNPSFENYLNISLNGNGTGNFESNLYDLIPSTTYFVRAYATNDMGTSYGEQVSFTTLATFPNVTTTEISLITSNSASSGGNVTYDGGTTVTARGIAYSTSQNPTISGNFISSGSGPGTFASHLSGLTPGATYFVRAFATNSIGTAYGEQLSFTTQAVIPNVITTEITSISTNSATISGFVTYEGGTTVTSRGIAYSTSQNPTIFDNIKTSGSGYGDFFAELSGLLMNTTYYACAFATNSIGTAYGEQLEFTTKNMNIPCPGTPSFTDSRDNNIYQTVQIGNQCWMKENLRYLPSVVPNNWVSEDHNYMYVFEYNGHDANEAKAMENYQTYGVLYNWLAAINGQSSSSSNPSGVQGICPSGWHLPSDEEWKVLETYLDMSIYASNQFSERGTNQGSLLKSTNLWKSNGNGTNTTGFTALPGGAINFTTSVGSMGLWWSSTESTTITDNIIYRSMSYNSDKVGRWNLIKKTGLSVRCVKD